MLKIRLRIKSIILVSITSLLVSCVSIIDTRVILPFEFENSADLIQFERPTWLFKDSFYEQPLADYAITNVKITSTSEKSELIREKKLSVVSFLLDSNIIGFHFLTNQNYEVNGNSGFSFNLSHDAALKVKSSCDINYLDSKSYQENHRLFGKTTERESIMRIDTSLVCSFSQDQKSWGLIVNADREHNMSLQLTDGTKQFELTTIMQSYSLYEKDKKLMSRTRDSRDSHNAGISISFNEQQISALSLVGQPKIWIKNDLDVTQRELLLAVNYSLAMFDWLNTDWRKSNF